MTGVNSLSESSANYLKAIYHLAELYGAAEQQQIATALGVSAAGVTKMLRSLAKYQLITYTPYKKVYLTELGRSTAIEIIRRHRLIELYLVKTLGYEWDKVHPEAERLEHYISAEFEERIERILGYPTVDPHGDPIPGRDGSMPPVVTTTLNSMPCDEWLVISRVIDEDDAFLRFLNEHGLLPGTRVLVVERELYGGSLRIRLPEREVRISPKAAESIFVTPEALLKLSDPVPESIRGI
jgi:DtxR family Mn-dependent transcriptional regulator